MRSTRRRLHWIPGILMIHGLAVGCPGTVSAPVATECVKQYDKCKLPSGPLGICDVRDCKPGETAPCLVCNPQH